MRRLAPSLRRFTPAFLFLAAAVSFTTWVGCGDDDEKKDGGGGSPTSSSFGGWFANGNESGQMGVTVSSPGLARRLLAPGAAAVEVSASGTLTLTGGGTVALTGTFDDETGDLALSGGGYTFVGLYDVGPPGNISGTYTGPNGSGQFTCVSGASSSAQVYGGTYLSDVSASSGTFLMSIQGGAIEGVAVEDGEAAGFYFSGALTGGTDITIAGSYNGADMTGTGTLNTSTNHVSGRYNIEFNATPTDSGVWSGDLITP